MIKRVYGARDYEGRFASWPRVPSERRPPGPALWMETMFLVAGLAVAGLVGIAAAFYFSIRSGNRGDKRLRSAGAGRAGADRHPGSRTTTARPDLNGHPRRTAAGGDDADVLDALADDAQRVQQGGEDDDRRPVLVVVEDGDVE